LFKFDAICTYIAQKHNLSPKYWKIEYWNRPKLSQVA